MTDEPQKSIHDNVLAAIQTGRVQMRPRWQFLVSAAFFVAGLVLSALMLLFVGSFIVFMLQQNGAWFAPAFGSQGFTELFFAMPVIFILVALIFVLLLHFMVRKYAFSYARPVLYTVLGLTLFVFCGSFLVAQTHLHEQLFNRARSERLPFAGGFYRQFGEPQIDRITPGEIVEIIEDGYSIRDPRNQQFKVIVTPRTKLPFGEEFEVGDDVIVLGDREGMMIIAEGIREIEEREGRFPNRLPNHLR